MQDSHWDHKELDISSGSIQLKTSSDTKKSTEKQPLPSYQELREKAETDILKIGSYLKGKTEYEIEEKITKKRNDTFVPDSTEQYGLEPVLPLLDTYAQSALRRRIVHDQLDLV